MNFVSFEFWTVLLGLIGLRKFLGLLLVNSLGKRASQKKKSRFDRVYLLASSLLLFGLEDFQSLTIFIGVSSLVFSAVLLLPRVKCSQKWVFTIGVSVIAILPLLYFKYAGFFTGKKSGLITFEELIIPIGLSFYTFQLISLLVDRTKILVTGKTLPETSLLDLANYASFFPQIVAGPIEREKNLIPQLKKFSLELKIENLVPGLKLIVLGLFYKLVMADNLAAAAPWLHQEINHPVLIHLGNVIFGLRIYGDFAGYSFIALGTAQLFGIYLTVNFTSPYSRVNIQDFWRSWHISLTSWFRDYIYIPLGGNRVVWSTIAVFLISGIWHGAGWGFVVWGTIHGIMMMAYTFSKRRVTVPNPLAWLVTFVLVSTAWLPFYQWDSQILLQKCQALLSLEDYLSSPFKELEELAGSKAGIFYILTSLLIAFTCLLLEIISRVKNKNDSQIEAYRWAMKTPAQCVLLASILILTPTQNNGFVYFNF